MNKFDLDNRVSVVTGGAQGFGFAITERFIQSGAKVIIWDIDKEVAETAIKKINSKKMHSKSFATKTILMGDDLSTIDQFKDLVSNVLKKDKKKKIKKNNRKKSKN